jgi:pyruvate dehydrogenase E2 component (dihydrolipoamide acetyltransferase)
MATKEFKLPDVGEGVAEGELVSWLVEPGDTVTEDQPVAEVETDKALVEVPSPYNGTVKELLAEEGEMVPVGNVLLTFDVPDEAGDDAAAEPEAESEEPAAEPDAAPEAEGSEAATEAAEPSEGRVFAPPSVRRLARELGVDLSTVEGSGPSGRVTEGDVRAAAEDGEPEPEPSAEPAREARSASERASGEAASTDETAEATGAEPATQAPSAAPAQVESADREQTLAAPATRRVADELDVDLNAVPATDERDGEAFVDEAAVRQYAEAQQAAQAADAEAVSAAGGAGAAEAGATGAAADQREERRPYRGVRKTIGEAMERSKFTAPHVTHHETVDVTALVETREELKPLAEERGIDLTYMPFVMKAMVAALEEHPILNSQLDEENEEIVVKHYYNVGIAVATDAGLMVPVVRDVEGKDMLQLASEVSEKAQKARDRSIGREEMQGSTISITNFGAIGGEYATPIINYPDTAIVGLGELKQRPWVVDGEASASGSASGEAASTGEVEARWTLPLSISIDHRVVDGADVAAFCDTLMNYLNNPKLLLLE